MDQAFLHDEFINALHHKIPHRPELVKCIANVLKIEKESASRRINGNVKFSVDEMGRLAGELNISIDALMFNKRSFNWVPMIFETPMMAKSIDSLADIIDATTGKIWSSREPILEFGSILGTLPVEFFIEKEHLAKFMFFKWGHQFVGTEEFNDFASWQMPEKLTMVRKRYESNMADIEKIAYIWDDSLVWALSREIEYLYSMQAIDENSKNLICDDLHELLTELEAFMKNTGPNQENESELIFYISSVPIGMNSWYQFSEHKCSAFFETSFTRSSLTETYESCVSIKNWISSLMNISTLISGSGQKERRLFFARQHKIINTLLK